MTNSDTIKGVTDLWSTYHDYEKIQEELGLTRYMIDKYVALARLPEEIKDAINQGAIHANSKTAENCAIRAVDSLGWIKGQSDPSIQDVIDFATELGKNEDSDGLEEEGKKGGTLEDMKKRAKKRVKKEFKMVLSKEIADKLQKVAESKGEGNLQTATKYVNDGVNSDYDELELD